MKQWFYAYWSCNIILLKISFLIPFSFLCQGLHCQVYSFLFEHRIKQTSIACIKIYICIYTYIYVYLSIDMYRDISIFSMLQAERYH